MAVDSELPVAIKAFFYLSATSTATASSVSLDVAYSGGGSEEAFGFLDFGASTGDGTSGTWTQGVVAAYPSRVISSARVRGWGDCSPLWQPLQKALRWQMR